VAFISLTRLRIRSGWFMPGFIYYALRSARQAKTAPGNLGVNLLRDAKKTFWTCTAWEDEAAMRGFMLANPHKESMSKLAHWCDEASVAHWMQETAALPEWQEAHRRMLAQGRRSKVKFPSKAQEAFEIPATTP
jgi:heme-degrading monooxygenase HmoA